MIEVKDLTKIYGTQRAVEHLSFTLESGKAYGFLGPNGAGKSTTMNIIAGCLSSTEGTVNIEGFDIYQDSKKAKASIGYLPEQPPLYMDMTPLEYLSFVGEAKGVKKYILKEQLYKAMKKTDLLDVKNRLIKNLSKGYRQRVGIASVLLGNPPIIILDEPTVGLDPKQIIEIRSLIASLKTEHTVILSSHILSEISTVCDYILILSNGKLVASDTPENLSHLLDANTTLSLLVRGKKQEVQRALKALPEMGQFAFQQKEDNVTHAQLTFQLHRRDTDIRDEIFYALCDARLPILGMELQTASLEEIFLELTDTGGEMNEGCL